MAISCALLADNQSQKRFLLPLLATSGITVFRKANECVELWLQPPQKTNFSVQFAELTRSLRFMRLRGLSGGSQHNTTPLVVNRVSEEELRPLSVVTKARETARIRGVR